ncbi:MAG: glycosyltransferase [Candidatus Scalindua sp.]|jgi:2-polyprenyl-3-methyl-5-hydroxy-6-metoxy-1,4-benzoquinol methylase|nr:glycosyltransferase [Candidatus Scalindua sp.]MBT5307322.1 glycosyltransferase [Candidatus Scalindua sp.]MBT6050946.1 glycosyltransferase [Candidatus Scalindua sp.]MBT6563170.1 glycosyltransferase [Candidatus Scalindua sp.]MBT7212498.1 glycosyltransferase [Candidatus Scalindua sp.]
MKSSEEDLSLRLAEQENRRTVYWNRFDSFVDFRMNWRASMMRHLFHILPGQKILEIGAGNGKFTRSLVKATRRECKITAVVFSPEYQDQVEKELNNKDVTVVYLDSFPGLLADEKYDYVIINHMLEDHFRNEFLYIIKQLIKPGGGLLLFEPNPWNCYFRVRKFFRRLIPITWERPGNPILMNKLEVFSVLSEIGYTQINVLPYDFLYSPIPRFLLWPAQNLSIIMENFPYFRNLAGSLYIWSRNPSFQNERQITVDLCDYQMLFGKVSFVIPCHNEEMNVAPLINGLIAFYGKYIFEILIVDDNSKDRTADVTEKLSKIHKCIRLIKRVPPNGVGRALREGLKEAKGEYILIMDSDFQHIIPEMRDLFDAIADGADVAIGSRFSRESVLVNYAFTKILANRAFHIIANILLGRHFRDISNNLKIFRRDVAKKLVIESDDFAANVETGLKPILLGYRVVEVPISWVNRSIDMGFSTFRIFKTGPNYWRILLRLVWRGITKQPCQSKTG